MCVCVCECVCVCVFLSVYVCVFVSVYVCVFCSLQRRKHSVNGLCISKTKSLPSHGQTLKS